MNDTNEAVARRSPLRGDGKVSLVELFRVIRRGKLAIAAATLLGASVAFIYAFTATEVWVSVAYVAAPRVEHFKACLERHRAFARVTGEGVVNVSALASKLFNDFIALSVTEGVKQEFIEGSAYYKNLIRGMDAADAGQVLQHVVDGLRVKTPDGSDISPHVSLSFMANTAADAKSILGDYIEFVNKRALALVGDEFGDRLRASVLRRQAELDSLEFKQESERKSYVAELKAALSTARRAGLKDYVGGRNIPDSAVVELLSMNRLAVLGEKYLSAELRTAEESPLRFPPRYYEVKRELQLLEPLLDYRAAGLSYSYSYRLPPSLPLGRQGPERALIVVLGLLSGGMLGCGWVLVAAVLRKSRALELVQPALREHAA